jgi:hypothetical protein
MRTTARGGGASGGSPRSERPFGGDARDKARGAPNENTYVLIHKSSNRNDFYRVVLSVGRNEAVHGAPFWCACRSGATHKGSATEPLLHRTVLGRRGELTGSLVNSRESNFHAETQRRRDAETQRRRDAESKGRGRRELHRFSASSLFPPRPLRENCLLNAPEIQRTWYEGRTQPGRWKGERRRVGYTATASGASAGSRWAMELA